MKFLSLLPLALIACTSNQPSRQDSQRARTATYAASEAALSKALAHVGAVAPAAVTLSFSGPCDLGGTVGLDGTYDESGTGDQASFDLNATFDACAEADGTVDGNLHWTSVEDATGFTQDLTGQIDWSDSNTSASCAFDLHQSITQTGITQTGTVCGYDVSEQISY
jgi:hypothetical protein